MMQVLEPKLKTALDETRLLILGAQVLFGFQFEAAFQELFSDLPAYAKVLHCVALLLLVVTIGCLIAPSLYHQVACDGESEIAVLHAATRFAGLALLPLIFGLSLSTFILFDDVFGHRTGAGVGVGFAVTGLILFYGLGYSLRRAGAKTMPHKDERTPLKTKIEQLLTESRVIIPGAQALLGFQLIATLTKPFRELPLTWQITHAGALCAVALAAMLLMTPAALHRLAFHGEDSERFFRISAGLVIAAVCPLAAGIAADIALVFFVVTKNDAEAGTFGLIALVLLFALWYAYPLIARRAQP